MDRAVRRRRAHRRAPRKFGAHMSIAGGCDRAIWAAHAVPFETVQLFTKNNNRWDAPRLSDGHAEAFRTALAQTGIISPVAHTSYLINLASPDDALWRKSIAALIVEVERCQLLGITDLVLHPGAHMGEGEDAGLTRVAGALDEVHRRTEGSGGPDRPGDDGRAGDEPGPPLRAPRGDPRPRRPPGAAGRLRGYVPYFRRGLSLGHAGGVR